VALTPKAVASLRATGEWQVVSDGIVPGLTLRVSPQGHRSYSLLFRIEGRQHRLTLGSAHLMSLAEARGRAKDALAMVRAGENPLPQRASAQASLTFADLCTRFIEARTANFAPSTAYEYGRQLRSEIAPRLGKTAAADLTRSQVRELLDDVAKRGHVMANRVFQFVRAVLRWAVREEYLPRNPAEGLQRPRREMARERTLTGDEIRIFWSACDSMSPAVAATARLLLLLGQRSTETIEMRWTDVDLDAALWTIPGQYRKGGRPHAIPLPPLACQIIRALKPATDGPPRVLAGVSVDNPMRWFDPLRDQAMALATKAKVTLAHFTKHDLRRTCATGCAKLGAAETTISRLLGHAVIAGTIPITAVYDRFTRLDEVKSTLAAWADHVEALVAAEHGQVAALNCKTHVRQRRPVRKRTAARSLRNG
jgi:integrase